MVDVPESAVVADRDEDRDIHSQLFPCIRLKASTWRSTCVRRTIQELRVCIRVCASLEVQLERPVCAAKNNQCPSRKPEADVACGTARESCVGLISIPHDPFEGAGNAPYDGANVKGRSALQVALGLTERTHLSLTAHQVRHHEGVWTSCDRGDGPVSKVRTLGY
jgi:hypothetical protein